MTNTQTIMGRPVEYVDGDDFPRLNDINLQSWSEYMATKITLNGKPMHETHGGILVAQELPEPQEPAKPKYPSTQIQNENTRKEIRRAMIKVYSILNDGPGGIVLPDDPSAEMRDVYNRLWTTLGGLMIGDDLQPENREIKC